MAMLDVEPVQMAAELRRFRPGLAEHLTRMLGNRFFELRVLFEGARPQGEIQLQFPLHGPLYANDSRDLKNSSCSRGLSRPPVVYPCPPKRHRAPLAGLQGLVPHLRIDFARELQRSRISDTPGPNPETRPWCVAVNPKSIPVAACSRIQPVANASPP